jgi:hypothetical protein
MSAMQAFFLGMMAALTPSLVILGWVLRDVPFAGLPDEPEN